MFIIGVIIYKCGFIFKLNFQNVSRFRQYTPEYV